MILSYSRYCMRFWCRLFPGSVFRVFRNYLWRSVGFKVHATANIAPTASLICGDIEVGAGTFIGEEVMITGGNIDIGAYCDIAPRCAIHAGSHEIGDETRRAGKTFGGEIRIGDGSWIGTHSTILAGAVIGKGTIVAAGAVVVAGQYPDNVLLAGVPAQVKKKLHTLSENEESKDA